MTYDYNSYKELAQTAADLQNAAAVLEWDQEVYMPSKGASFRGRQLATLAKQAHEMLTSDKYERILKSLLDDKTLDETQQNNIRLSYDDFEKNKKLPSEFVEALSKQSSLSFNAWIKARQQNDYSIYAPELQKMIGLKRKQADLYGYEKHPYDALLDEYEKGATVAMLDPVFKMVQEQLTPFLKKIASAKQVDDTFFNRNYPKQAQWDFAIEVLKTMGYDMEAGRQDLSEHPFTTSFSPEDVRITTRVDENNFASLFWSSVHEGGHALYEQGLPTSEYGLPLGAAASLSIHESQSRLWENCVSRSYGYWKHFYPKLQGYFPQSLGDVSLDSFYRGMNQVVPSLVRTEADEVTYHFHVMIRYEIEKALMDGSLSPEDVSGRWNDMYQEYLGIRPKDDKTGVLQDVHWTHGSFGYFPTYSLGSFYAAQFFEQAKKEIPGLDGQIEQAEFGNLLQWLRKSVHQYGRRYTSDELCRKITGRSLDFSSFMSYIEEKYAGVYDLK